MATDAGVGAQSRSNDVLELAANKAQDTFAVSRNEERALPKLL